MAYWRGGCRGGNDGARGSGGVAGVGRNACSEAERFSIREILPHTRSGSWPQDFTVSRGQIYDDMGRLTGGPEDNIRRRPLTGMFVDTNVLVAPVS